MVIKTFDCYYLHTNGPASIFSVLLKIIFFKTLLNMTSKQKKKWFKSGTCTIKIKTFLKD